MNKKISHINLLTKNKEELIKFYTDIVGLRALEDSSENWFGFDTGEVTFAIEPMSNRDKYEFEYKTDNPTLIQFKADSEAEIIKWTDDLEAKGAVIGQRLIKKNYGIVTTFADPDGNLIELLYEIKQ